MLFYLFNDNDNKVNKNNDKQIFKNRINITN